MEPELFSFSKKAISSPMGQRLSVISAQLPADPDAKRKSATSTRTFSESSHCLVEEQMMSDDPLLDYNQQIRAPKLKQTNKSARNIGMLLPSIELEQKNDDLFTFGDFKAKDGPACKYQPADVDVSKLISPITGSVQPQQSLVYNINDFLQNVSYQSNHVISNLNMEYTHKNASEPPSDGNNTEQTTPLTSAKPSNDSINFNFIESSKQPRFNMIPVKPIDEPKTLSYLPCVLRTTSNTIISPPDTADSNLLTRTRSIPLFPVSEDADLTYKPHWKPNNSTSCCLDCQKPFSIINRRHHCRKCGEIFCGNCLLSKARLQYDELAQEAKFDVSGIICKVCFQCGKNWSTFIFQNFKDDEGASDVLYPNLKQNLSTVEDRRESITANNEPNTVPADWTWSSF